MTRTRTPTAVLELRGSFRKNPARKADRQGEPRPADPLGVCPARIKGPAKAAWNELREQGFWLTSADAFMIEIAADLMAMHRANAIDNPARSLLVGTLAKLGFGPSERSKLSLPGPEKPTTGFAQFA